MTFVTTRTDQTGHSAVDGVAPNSFGTTIEASAEGFGLRTTVKGVEVFEVLDALPLNRAAIRTAVESGTTSAAAVQAGITAIDFATFDQLTAAEVTAAGGIKSGSELNTTGGAAPAASIITVTAVAATVNEGDTIRFNIAGGPANTAVTLAWSGSFTQSGGFGGTQDNFYGNVSQSDGVAQGAGENFSTLLTLDGTGSGWWQTIVNNDSSTEGTETLTLTVSAAGYTTGTATVTVLDTSV